jgi:plasmid stabilization system protein ParE
MVYKVNLTAGAEADVYAAFERIREVSPLHAERWLTGLFKTVFSLSELPNRCPLIPEAKEMGLEIRQLLFGKRTGTYRIIFDIQEVSEEVRVLRIWHSSRDRLRLEDLEEEK